jgi:monoamine oxidase
VSKAKRVGPVMPLHKSDEAHRSVSSLRECSSESLASTGNMATPQPTVIIVGAGAAGLTAGYTLHQAGWSIQILEANPETIGGRIRKDNSTWDIPVDLGAEWIHVNPDTVRDLVSHPLPELSTRKDNVKRTVWDGVKFHTEKYTECEHRWVNYSWWDFFNDNIASFIREHIILGCAVKKIDFSCGNVVKVSCRNGKTFSASYVIVTASIKVLQDKLIEFVPRLPINHERALQKFRAEPALKVFIEFKEKFYPNILELESDCNRLLSKDDERLFYDESFRHSTSKHILGMYVYGRAAHQYLNCSGDVIVKSVLHDLDRIFAGKATRHYQRHIVQNWADEAYIRTGFTRWVMDDQAPIAEMCKPVSNRIFFAGEALPVDQKSWGFAHGAALSGQLAARRILQR